tara:strand:+ start:48 stop:614 length:567 start_codon:yes stop_codon:yes gene_type:complete
MTAGTGFSSSSGGGASLPYKVYTALLTQSGGDSPASIYGNEYLLVIGVTYTITEYEIPFVYGDFTNVGAPNNEIGTSFVATGTTPNSWGSTSLTYNEGAPVTTVLENTIGNVWFTYQNQGTYLIYSDNLFTANKTATFTTTSVQPSEPLWITINWAGTSEIYLTQFDVDGNYINGLPINTPIEIRIYN